MNFDKLKDLMNSFVDDGYAIGNTVTVYLDSKNVYNYSCGYSDLKTKTLMTGNEHFNFYSCSKPITVTAALQLFERGRFLLSDPLYEYIPEFRDMYIKSPDGELVKATKPITILNLFNMTAGFDYNTKSEAFEKAREITNGKMNTLETIKCLASMPLLFEPGTRFQYSLCHDVLAAVVEAISGKKFRDFVKENIFDPLDMTQSVYHITPEIEKNMATQYTFMPHGEKELDFVNAQMSGSDKRGIFTEVGTGNYLMLGEEYDSGGAGVISTAQDYAKFATALANFGKGMTGERILSPATVELMRTNSLDSEQIKTLNWSQLKGYGYGFGVRTMMDKIKASSLGSVGEFGWGGAAGSSVYIDPDKRLAAVYCKHNLNPFEQYYQPRVRNVLYACLED